MIRAPHDFVPDLPRAGCALCGEGPLETMHVRTAVGACGRPDPAPTRRKPTASGWHRSKARLRSGTLVRTWIHDDGTEIFQGCPDAAAAADHYSRRFVYRVVRPDGTITDFEHIKDAKGRP